MRIWTASLATADAYERSGTQVAQRVQNYLIKNQVDLVAITGRQPQPISWECQELVAFAAILMLSVVPTLVVWKGLEREMAGNKRHTSLKSSERNFPHIVEIVVPLGGLGNTLDAIYDFHARHGIRAKHGRTLHHENGHNYIRWRFADPGTAAEFSDKFGGTIFQH